MEPFEKYFSLLIELDKSQDIQFEEHLRDEMEDLWYSLSDQEECVLNIVSSMLLNGKEITLEEAQVMVVMES
jgi:hypothetical protein